MPFCIRRNLYYLYDQLYNVVDVCYYTFLIALQRGIKMKPLDANTPKTTDAVRAAILVAKSKSQPVNQVIDTVTAQLGISRTFAIKLIVSNWGSVITQPERI